MERETIINRIDYCSKCNKVYLNSATCPACSEDTKNTGWYETEVD